MITHEQLNEWFVKAKLNKQESLELAQKYSNNIKLSEYYLHLSQVADHQLSLIYRMFDQERMNEELGIKEK